jgi:hypothetical protein
MDSQQQAICTTPGCGQPAEKRDKCKACYQLLNRLRKKLGVGWDVFERAGHCGPRKRRVATDYAKKVTADVAELIEREKSQKLQKKRRLNKA